ncbi:proton-conducting transporter membrane subunit [Bdellovibrionota bacterium FG-2]
MRELIAFLPEIILSITLLSIIFAEITYQGSRVRFTTLIALLGLSAAFLQTLVALNYGPTFIFGKVLVIDGLSLFFNLFFTALGALAVISAVQVKEISRSTRTEYCALVVAACLVMCLAASAADLLLLFLSLLCVNIVFSVLAAFGKRSILSIEAGIKYLLFSVVSVGFLLFGIALIFAATHELNIYEIHRAILTHSVDPRVMFVTFLFFFFAIGFQVAAFPFYLWAPDVVEGAPTPVSSFLVLGSRGVGFAVLLRLVLVLLSEPTQAGAAGGELRHLVADFDWPKVLANLAGFSMLFGALLALRQKGAKRMVGCLAVSQTGFFLMAPLVLDQQGVAALMYNLVIEVFALTGIFFVLSVFYDEMRSDRLVDFKGILGKAVLECICLILFLLCLVGIPPLPGFIGKFALVGSAVQHGWIALAAIAIFSMGVSMAAVARFIYAMISDFRKPVEAGLRFGFRGRMFLFSLVVPMLLCGGFAEVIFQWAGKHLGSILW